jgi:hypothetical protein
MNNCNSCDSIGFFDDDVDPNEYLVEPCPDCSVLGHGETLGHIHDIARAAVLLEPALIDDLLDSDGPGYEGPGRDLLIALRKFGVAKRGTPNPDSQE